MKVVNASGTVEGPSTGIETPTIDQSKVEELKEKFDSLQEELRTKTYDVYLNSEQADALLNNFYPKFKWKGYESYAVSETYNRIKDQVKGGELKGSLSTEIVEAAFHFIKNYEGEGISDAILFKGICDQFALPMQEINKDRQTLKDVSLELVATEQGITVENLVQNLNKEYGNQGY